MFDSPSPEILAPAGSFDALKAAVFAGADAVYFGASAFNARRGAPNFGDEAVKEAIDFCHRRGVACHLTLNTLVSGRELPAALDTAQKLIEAGADALIVQDPGLAYEIRKRSDVPLHASTQMTVHNLDGILFAQQMGFDRAVLSREVSRSDLEYLAQRSPLELEVFVHGALCMCYSGQCYMSSLIGNRSGNRGECAQPCRLPYREGYTLSLKDLCLLKHFEELRQMGIASLKIEGRMKSPEYVAAVTEAYAAAKRGKEYTPETEAYLARVFSRSGFTDGYYTGRLGEEMFGVRGETEVRHPVPTAEFPRLALSVSAVPCEEGVRFTAVCGSYSAEDVLPVQPAKTRPTSPDEVRAAFDALGNTPYYIETFDLTLPEGAFLPASGIKRLRRDLLERLTAMRTVGRRSFRPSSPGPWESEPCTGRREGFFLHPDRIGDGIDLDFLWLPLFSGKEGFRLAERYPGKVGVVLPRVIGESEKQTVLREAARWTDLGVKDVLCGNVGHLPLCASLGWTAHGDYGLNVYNPASRDVFLREGVASVTLSFELSAARQREMTTGHTGVIVYGRLPFMIFRNCRKKQHGADEFLTDRIGKRFLLTCDFGCRNQLWNADVLWLADKDRTGLGFERFLFTDESPRRIREVIAAYREGRPPQGEYTRGHFEK